MTIDSLIMGKALNLSAPYILSTIKTDNDLDLWKHQAQQISDKLDRLIEAPYHKAMYQLQEGEIEKAKESFLDAFTHNPLNIPAKLMYAFILCQQDRVERALSIYWELFRDFSYRIDLIPEDLYQLFLEYMQTLEIKKEGQFEVRYGSDYNKMHFYPSNVWCSSNGIAIEWTRKNKAWFREYTDFATNVYSWDGRCLYESEISTECIFDFGLPLYYGKTSRVVMVTETYFVITDDEKYICYSMKNGNPEPNGVMDEEKFTSVFIPSKMDITKMDLYNLSRFSYFKEPIGFKDVNITTGEYEESYIYPYYIEYLSDSLAHYNGGTVNIKFK